MFVAAMPTLVTLLNQAFRRPQLHRSVAAMSTEDASTWLEELVQEWESEAKRREDSQASLKGHNKILCIAAAGASVCDRRAPGEDACNRARL